LIKHKFFKKISCFSAVCVSTLFLSSCSFDNCNTDYTDTSDTNTGEATTPIEDVVIDEEDTYTEIDEENENIIFLNGASIYYSGINAQVNGSTITIKNAGEFYITGTLTNGQIIVDAESVDEVKLYLNGVNINCSSSAPINIKKAKKVTISLEENTENILTDGASYVYDDADEEEPNATLFSKADLTINGKGKLTVNANFNNAIRSKDALVITGGDFVINSADDGIIGKDSLIISNAVFDITAGGDVRR